MKYMVRFDQGLKTFLAVALAALVSAPAVFAAQQQKSDKAPPKPAAVKAAADAPAKSPWQLRVSKTLPQTFSLKANDAPLSEVAAELGKLAKVPVHVGGVMQGVKISLDFSDLPLEPTLRLLAPQSYVDYETGGADAAPKPLALYLYGANEAPPASNLAVNSNTQTLLIEGDTEEGTEEYEKKVAAEENPLRITFANKQLSVRADKQPLTVVLYKIASEMGVPFDLRHESTEVIDVKFSNYSLEHALRTLSPSVRFYYRADLQSFETQPLRIALVAPAKT